MRWKERREVAADEAPELRVKLLQVRSGRQGSYLITHALELGDVLVKQRLLESPFALRVRREGRSSAFRDTPGHGQGLGRPGLFAVVHAVLKGHV